MELDRREFCEKIPHLLFLIFTALNSCRLVVAKERYALPREWIGPRVYYVTKLNNTKIGFDPDIFSSGSIDEIVNRLTHTLEEADELVTRIYGQPNGTSFPEYIVFEDVIETEMHPIVKKIYRRFLTEREMKLLLQRKSGIEKFFDIILLEYKDNDEMMDSAAHSLTHTLQSNIPSQLRPDSERFQSTTFICTEPFAFYSQFRSGIRRFSSDDLLKLSLDPQFNYIFELIDLYITPVRNMYTRVFSYFPIPGISSISSGEFCDKVRSSVEELDKLLSYAFNFYRRNQLLLDVIALQGKRHELAIEIPIALKYDPLDVVKGARLKKGLEIANEVWNENRANISKLQNADFYELANSYLAGGEGTGKDIYSNKNDIKNLILREVEKQGYSRREALVVYHHFLRSSFSRDRDFYYDASDSEKLEVVKFRIAGVLDGLRKKLIYFGKKDLLDSLGTVECLRFDKKRDREYSVLSAEQARLKKP